MPAATTALTPGYFKLLLRLLRPFPNFDFTFIKPLRARAVGLLRLQPNDRVLDLGCGPGGSFPYLAQAVGAGGEVVGVEISPDVAVNASRRIAKNRWPQVRVVVASAETVQLDNRYDGALMFGAPDVYASTAAVALLLDRLKPGARVAFFGAKTSTRRLGWLLNPLLRRVFPALSFATTPIPDDAPWRVLAPHLEQFEVTEYFLGWMFLASGTFPGAIRSSP